MVLRLIKLFSTCSLNIMFYDYTKIANRDLDIPNYKLTFSYSEASPVHANKQCKIAIERGMNVAVVFRSKESILTTFAGLPVIDGDKTDLRFLDPTQCVVGLYAKGKAKRDNSGFVQDAA